MKILLAVDGSPCSDAAVDEVVRRPWPHGSEIRAISVYDIPAAPAAEPWAMPVNYFDEVEKVARESTQTFLDATVRKLEGREDDSVIISSEIIEGSPKRVILDEAERWNADLIVVGSHGYGILDRLLLGSVSQALALHAPCSVEIVRSRPENESGKVDG